MVESTKKPIRIDLNQFKLHLSCLKPKTELTFHFNSPSRMFYLSVMALVVNEMKRLGRITSISMDEHLDLLALLNETVGGSAGSSDKEHLLPRIYRKWKNVLPHLENASLFNVLGRKKEYDDGIGKNYVFSEEEKDRWANLFEYRGSEENVRLRFSIDKLGASLGDVTIVYGENPELIEEKAWERFIARLKQERENKAEAEHAYPNFKERESVVSQPSEWGIAFTKRWMAVAAAVVILIGLAGWYLYLEQSKRVEPASLEKMAFALPDKPSIAVLPFKNLSGDPKQDYFSDGLTDQISSTLSRLRTLFVISSSSTSTYKGKPVKIQKVAEDLGVKYVLEGSVQRSADRVRITVQLIDATTGHQIWSQRYDREQKDIFAIQDDITLAITKALRIDLMSGEQALNWQKNSTTNLEAWEKYLQGDDHLFRFTKEDNATARRLFEEVIVLDLEYADAYNLLGWTYFWDARFGWVDSRAESFKMASKYAQKALELNDTLDTAHLLIGGVYLLQGQHEKAIAETERAIALNPNSASNYIGMAGQVGCLGRWDESVQLAKKAIRLHPFAPAIYYHWLGRGYFMTGQLDESITTFKKALHVSPNYLPAHAFLAACYSSLDRHAEAAAEADEVRSINPKFNLESYAKTLPYENKADIERYIAALRKAGLK